MDFSNHAKRGGRIPIPSSFANNSSTTAASDHDDHDVASPQQQQRQQTNDDIETIKACWNKDHLMVTERFLFVQFQKRQQQYLSFTEFYGVASKVQQQIRASKMHHQSNNDEPQKLAAQPEANPDFFTDLTKEERLLYNLLAATSPTLYRMDRIEESSRLVTKTNQKTKKPQLSWKLVLVNNKKNRLQELRALLEKQRTVGVVPLAKSNAILAAIKEHRLDRAAASSKHSTAAAPATNQNTKPKAAAASSPAVQAVLMSETATATSSTVEERVRARAVVALAQQHEDHQRGHTDNDAGFMDRDWLVRLTDALWSHCAQMRSVRVQAIGGNSTVAAAAATAVIPLKDVVSVLRKSLSTRSGSSGAVHRGETVNKRRVVEALLHLSGEFPGWIVLNKVDISQDSLLRVHHGVDYTAIRAQLTGTESLNKEPTVDHKKTATRVNSILHPPSKQIHKSQRHAVVAKKLIAKNSGRKVRVVLKDANEDSKPAGAPIQAGSSGSEQQQKANRSI